MKGNAYKGELGIVTTGELDGTKATISAEKQSKLFELLQAPYANPIGSIVRETSTNAWDAHVEAGQSAPILINLNWEKASGYYIEFVDQGVGMSPERMYNVYVNYLESTKEDTNDQSGYFGIGSKSPLSYTSEYFVTTVYNNIRYEYLIRKDDDGVPVLNKLGEETTSDVNGTTVKVYIDSENDAKSFISEVKSQLYFFEHVYFSNGTSLSNQDIENDFKVIKGEHFVCRLQKSPTGKYRIRNEKFKTLQCAIGQVTYPIKEELIDKYLDQMYPVNDDIDDDTDTENLQEYLKNEKIRKKILQRIGILKEMNIGIRVPIGDPLIGVTMTREDIKYRKDTIPYIISLIDKAFEEVHEKNMLRGQNIDFHKLVKNAQTHLEPGQTIYEMTKYNSLSFDVEIMDSFRLKPLSNPEAYKDIKNKPSTITMMINGKRSEKFTKDKFIEPVFMRVKEWIDAGKITGINSERVGKGPNQFNDLRQFLDVLFRNGVDHMAAGLLTDNINNVDTDALRTLGATIAKSGTSNKYHGAVYVFEMDPAELMYDKKDDINRVIGLYLNTCEKFEELNFDVSMKNIHAAIHSSYKFYSLDLFAKVEMSDMRTIEATRNDYSKTHYDPEWPIEFSSGKRTYLLKDLIEFNRKYGTVVFMRKSQMGRDEWNKKSFYSDMATHSNLNVHMFWVDAKNEKLVREYGLLMLDDINGLLPMSRKTKRKLVISNLRQNENLLFGAQALSASSLVQDMGYDPQDLYTMSTSIHWDRLGVHNKEKLKEVLAEEVLNDIQLKSFEDDCRRIHKELTEISKRLSSNFSRSNIYLSLRFGKPIKGLKVRVYKKAIDNLKLEYEAKNSN